MLFLTHWKLNEDMPMAERQEVGRKLLEDGHFPPEGVELIRWDATPDGWGILLLEADSAADVQKALAQWRASGAGFFESTKTAPALPVREAMENAQGLLQELS